MIRMARLHALMVTACMVALASCATVSQVQSMKALADQGRYPEIADQRVECEASADGCNQLHLLKGDACFRQSKADSDQRVRYLQCASDELERGIAATRDWHDTQSSMGTRARYYENLCEALRELQDTQEAAEARLTNRRLLETAKTFLQAEPDHLAARFFIQSATFAQLQLNPERLRSADTACTDLNKQLTDLASVQDRAAASPYAPNYKRLRLDIAGTRRTIKGCQ